MDSFLGRLAARLYDEYGDGVSSIVVLFPNRRSQLFFNEALASATGKPMWQPRYMTLEEIMQQLSGLTAGDQLRLVTELYKVYTRFHAESFDSFYFWGEMLLGDFDSVDQYMVDADMLFANLSDLKYLESDLSYLTSEMREVITHFWKSVGAEADFSSEKQRFVTIWKSLAAVYHQFKESLSSQGLAYNGMICRRAVENIEAGIEGELLRTKYIAVGFNALSVCEERVFKYLQKNYDIDFVWDYDNYYLLDEVQEAGRFLREDIRLFPTRMETGLTYDNFVAKKDIRIVSSPSDSLQCKYVNRFLEEITLDNRKAPGKETAVVLLDEGLLSPVLYSLPEGMDDVNITMGYPLRNTLAYTFVERLIALQEHKRASGGRTLFNRGDISGIVRHPYFDAGEREVMESELEKQQRVYVDPRRLKVEGLAARLLIPVESWHGMSDYLLDTISAVASLPVGDREEWRSRNEFFAHIDDQIRKLGNSLDECGIELSMRIYISLVRRVLQLQRIPYNGEPLQGVQVMGILETRNIDFENVVVLSLADDTYPGSRTSSSFIPYSLRLAYGMPVIEHNEGVSAYYFYRLLQRARRIDLVYCSRADDKHTGEPSRYIHQLNYESPHAITNISLSLDANLSADTPIVIEKHGETAVRLAKYLNDGGRTMSPTALSAFLHCPMRFYFRYIAHIKPQEEITDNIDSPVFGSILHRSMELLYIPLLGIADPSGQIRALISSPAVTVAVDTAISELLFDGEVVEEASWGGSGVLSREVICRYINDCILPFDAAQRGITIKELEKEVSCVFYFRDRAGECHSIKLRGIADRIDTLADGTLRVVDYKTGRPDKAFGTLRSLFFDLKPTDSGAVLQALLYSMMMQRNGVRNVAPSLYFVREMQDQSYSPVIEEGAMRGGVRKKIGCYEELSEEFESLLSETLGSLFNPAAPFTQCSDQRHCQYCDYAPVCRR